MAAAPLHAPAVHAAVMANVTPRAESAVGCSSAFQRPPPTVAGTEYCEPSEPATVTVTAKLPPPPPKLPYTAAAAGARCKTIWSENTLEKLKPDAVFGQGAGGSGTAGGGVGDGGSGFSEGSNAMRQPR